MITFLPFSEGHGGEIGAWVQGANIAELCIYPKSMSCRAGDHY